MTASSILKNQFANSTKFQLDPKSINFLERNDTDQSILPAQVNGTSPSINFPYTHTDNGSDISVNDDVSPGIRTSNIIVRENEGYAVFTIVLSNPHDEAIQIDYSTVENTAKSGIDFKDTQGTLVFEKGELQKTIRVLLMQDGTPEINKTFDLVLKPQANTDLNEHKAKATIIDQDAILFLPVDDQDIPADKATLDVTVATLESTIARYQEVFKQINSTEGQELKEALATRIDSLLQIRQTDVEQSKILIQEITTLAEALSLKVKAYEDYYKAVLIQDKLEIEPKAQDLSEIGDKLNQIAEYLGSSTLDTATRVFLKEALPGFLQQLDQLIANSSVNAKELNDLNATREALNLLVEVSKSLLDGSSEKSQGSYINSVEESLREVSPGLEGVVWQKTQGNLMQGGFSDWFISTPGIWGDAQARDRSTLEKNLNILEEMAASTTKSFYMSCLAPTTSGEFLEATARGLKTAVSRIADGEKIDVKILGGAAPLTSLLPGPEDGAFGKWLSNRGLPFTGSPKDLLKKLHKSLGDEAYNKLDIKISYMNTSANPLKLSFNHAKTHIIDGKDAIVGGQNLRSWEYLNKHPICDASIRISGGAAQSAQNFFNALWKYSYEKPVSIFTKNTSNSSPYNDKNQVKILQSEPFISELQDQGIEVLAVGSLGYGILKRDSKSTFQFSDNIPETNNLSRFIPNLINKNADYRTVNPDLTALHTLAKNATKSIKIYQQDVTFLKAQGSYDYELFSILAHKMLDGIPVHIVISNTLNHKGITSFYGNVESPKVVVDAFLDVFAKEGVDRALAQETLQKQFSLSEFRASFEETWADGSPFILHNKMLMVDDSAFYIGSNNLYPVYLQEFGYIIDNKSVAKQIKSNYFDKIDYYSKPYMSTKVASEPSITEVGQDSKISLKAVIANSDVKLSTPVISTTLAPSKTANMADLLSDQSGEINLGALPSSATLPVASQSDTIYQHPSAMISVEDFEGQVLV